MIKRLCLLIILAIVPVLMAHQPAALADSQSQVIDGINTANGGAPTKTSTLNDTVNTVINLLSVAVGVVSVIMIIFAGFKYVTSAGNAEQTKSAKNTLIYAVVGLVIVGLAQTISHFVLTTVGQ